MRRHCCTFRAGAESWRCGCPNNPPAYTLGLARAPQTGQPTVGSPIVVAGAVWDIDLSGKLFALDAGSGTTLYQTQLGGQPTHFAALSYGGGQIYTASVAAPPPISSRPETYRTELKNKNKKACGRVRVRSSGSLRPPAYVLPPCEPGGAVTPYGIP